MIGPVLELVPDLCLVLGSALAGAGICRALRSEPLSEPLSGDVDPDGLVPGVAYPLPGGRLIEVQSVIGETVFYRLLDREGELSEDHDRLLSEVLRARALKRGQGKD